MIYIGLKAFILGVVEAVTEFLPVSSTGHMIILGGLLNFDNHDGHAFEICIQMGAVLAVLILYFQKFFSVLVTAPTNRESRQFIYKISIAFFPAAIIGLATYSFIEKYLFNSLSVAIMLILGGIIMLLVERFRPSAKYSNVDDMGLLTALKIGMYQVVSLVPGVSRSGATIVGGLCSGLDRKTATEFSFFLSVPTIVSASMYGMYKNRHLLSTDNLTTMAIGFFTTFIVSIFVIKWLLRYVSQNDFRPFACYRIILGIIILMFYL